MPSFSWKQDKPPTEGECRTKFYNHYREIAKEHDKEFLEKYDQDFNTTLIFVGYPWDFGGHVLTGVIGWSVVRGHFRIYHPGQHSTPA